MRYFLVVIFLFSFGALAQQPAVPQKTAPAQQSTAATSPKAAPAPVVPKIKNPAFAYAQPEEWVQGNPQSIVTVTEYASLSCPHCAHFNETVMPEITKKFIATKRIAFIYRDFPLNAPALKGAVVANCMPEDKRADFIATLYKNQTKWAFTKDYEMALQTLAIDAGLSKKALEKCTTDKKMEEAAVKSRLDGVKELGVGGTPSLYINGDRYENAPDPATVSATIEKYLAGQIKKIQ